jgi:hypothetical protein
MIHDALLVLRTSFNDDWVSKIAASLMWELGIFTVDVEAWSTKRLLVVNRSVRFV